MIDKKGGYCCAIFQERAALAMQAAFKKAVAEHLREGLPMYLWRDRKVVAVPAQELLERS